MNNYQGLRNKNHASFSIMLVCLLLVLVSCGEQNSNSIGTKKEFSIGMVTFAGYAPLYLAVEKGFFGDLEVKLNRIDDVSSIRAAMENGSLDAYLATLDIALDTNQEPPGVAVWAIDESAGGDGVVLSGNISSISDLKGKSIAAEPGLPPYFVMLYLLNQEGLGLKDINFQDMTTQNAATAYVSESVEGAGLYEPYLTTAAKQRDGSKIALSSADVPGLIVDLIFVNDELISSRTGDIETLVEGWKKALEFIDSNPEEANKIMASAFSLDIDEFIDIASSIRWLSSKENGKLLGTGNTEGTLFTTFDTVLAVLKNNREGVFDSSASKNLTTKFVK